MRTTSLSPCSEPDEAALDKALRLARLQQLTLEAERLRLESRQAVAAHAAASERLAQAIREARAQLALARNGARHASQAMHPPSAPAAPPSQPLLLRPAQDGACPVAPTSPTFHASLPVQPGVPPLPHPLEGSPPRSG